MGDPTGSILVAEDEPDLRAVVAAALEHEGYDVLTAHHGRAALTLLLQHHPDVILLDMRMPVMDGWEFARRYRQLPGPHAPIVVMTAALNARSWAEAIQAQAYVAKPFDLDELLRKIERVREPPAAG